jgi:hypothetical protein
MADFKVRVVENIGTVSDQVFGAPGSILEVKYGTLETESTIWSNNKFGLTSVEELNRQVGDSPTFNTVFEPVGRVASVIYDIKKCIRYAVTSIKEGVRRCKTSR